MKNKLGNKLVAIMFIPFFLMLIASIAYITYMTSRYVTDRTELEILKAIEINTKVLEEKMHSTQAIVVSAAEALAVIDKQSELVRTRAENIIQSVFQNKYIYNAWFAFEPNAFDGKDTGHTTDYAGAQSGRFIRSYIIENGQVNEINDMDERTIDDPKQSPWYVIPRDSGRLHFYIDNEPYDYKTGSTPVYDLSITMPVRMDDQVIGCVGVTVMLEDFDISVKGSERTVTALFDQNGIIYFSSDPSYIGKSIHLMTDTAPGGEPVFLSNDYAEMLGERAFIYTCPINLWEGLTEADDSGRFYLYVATPRSAIFNDLIPLYLAIFAIAVILLAVVLLITRYISERITKPLYSLTIAAKAVSQGDLNAKIAFYANFKDEIGVLSGALCEMLEQFRIHALTQKQAGNITTARLQFDLFITQANSISQAFKMTAALLRHQYSAVKITIVRANTAVGADYVLTGSGEAYSEAWSFNYHSEVLSLLADKRLVFLNSFIMKEQNVRLAEEDAQLMCLIPLITEDKLHGYIILESKDGNDISIVKEEGLLLQVADRLAVWVSAHKDSPVLDAPVLDAPVLDAPVHDVPVQDEPATNTTLVPAPDFLSMLSGLRQLDVDTAFATMGGMADVYERSVRLFAKLALDTIKKLDETITTDIQAFAIEIHGIKGSLNNIGAMVLGGMAARLEDAAKSGDTARCAESYPELRTRLLDFHNSLVNVLGTEEDTGKQTGDIQKLRSLLTKAAEAACEYNAFDAKEVMQEASETTYGVGADALIQQIITSLDVFDCDNAVMQINELEGLL